MKTEQEQIKAIKQIIDERVETTLGYVQGRHGNVIKTVDTVIIPRDIADAAYGDVSEYKDEIERLEEKCEELRNEKWNAQDDLDCYCDEMPNKIKQAKIDVLNELKGKMFEREYMGVKYKERIFYESEIDDMIAEVQNGEDKG